MTDHKFTIPRKPEKIAGSEFERILAKIVATLHTDPKAAISIECPDAETARLAFAVILATSKKIQGLTGSPN